MKMLQNVQYSVGNIDNLVFISSHCTKDKVPNQYNLYLDQFEISGFRNGFLLKLDYNKRDH